MLARLVGWMMTLKELALPMRCSRCGKKAAEVVAVAKTKAVRDNEESALAEEGRPHGRCMFAAVRTTSPRPSNLNA
jgi:hypothetical protein